MAALHRRNATRLALVLDTHGWPGISLVGKEAEEAAWLVVQHAIGEPAFMRRALALLEPAAAAGEAPAWQPALLVDRIRTLEPLATRTAAARVRAQREGERPPADPEPRQQEMTAWAIAVGWRRSS